MEREDVLSRPSLARPAAGRRPVISQLFRTKSIDQILADADHPTHRLKKSLTAWDLTCLGIGAIIGTGIFVLIGTAIVGDAHRPGAGPGIVLSFAIPVIGFAILRAVSRLSVADAAAVAAHYGSIAQAPPAW